jgi:Leucine-rich repeat (LRR) protein
VIAEAKPDPAGPNWVVSGDQIVIDRGVRPSDRDAADDPVRQQFQTEIARLAGELVHPTTRLTNTRTWAALSTTAAAFRDTLSADPHTIPTRLGPAYAQLLRLGGFLETDIRVQNDHAAMDGPLDGDIHGLLTALVRTAAPWLRGFPTVEAWDDQAGKALLRPELFQSARDFVRIARDAQVISGPDAAEMAALGEAGGNAGYQQIKAGNRNNAGAMNLILSTAMTFALGAVASDFATRSPLVQRAGAALANGAAAVEAFAATRSADLRQALLGLTREGRQGDEPAPAAIAPKIDPQVPEDVEEQATHMILAGHAPPEAWRPFILHLHFNGETALTDVAPLAGLMALQDLWLAGTQVSDVAPLAGLTALQNLRLNNTQVSDVAPLAGLTALQNLFLSRTQVSDVAPLAGLTALQNLYLDNTQVSDVAPLAGLTALQILFLGNTQVSDVAPMAGLTALQILFLSRTQVSDVAPLAGLTALQDLYLDGTQVSDVAPLASLTALKLLDLDNTQVSDVAPLAGLTALQILRLNNTRVSDVAPLAGLTALQNLYLDNTQVSNVAPLAGLTALQILFLSRTQVSDVAPLAGLTALQILFLSRTQVSDVAPLAGLTALQDLYLDGTQVSDVAPLASLIALKLLDLDNTQVSDVAPLAGLIELLTLHLNSTPVRDLSALDRLENLVIIGGATQRTRLRPPRRRSRTRK